MHNHGLSKKGFSLVTVLIFMMVATIAATATFKWLSSVGFTSADRMAIAEAKEASHAGLDAVRSWMTYHANDVGAIVRQYYDGGKKPVALTNLVHGVASNKQHFSVLLTAVDASRDTYKFTIVSTGTSRTDAKYSETSVLNVRGLYKVKIPVKLVHKSLDFGYSYFGGSTKGAQGAKNTSMLVNGNWDGNPPIVDEDFVVTGNAKLSGNDLDLGKHTCIGGDFVAENAGIGGHNLYVHGDAKDFNATLAENAYFNGDVEIKNTKGIDATGDVTINGRYYTGQSVKNTINGNLCMGPKATLAFGENMDTFRALKNVKFLNQSSPLDFSKQNYKQDQTFLGGEGYKVYIPHLKSCVGSNYQGCKSLPNDQKSQYVRYNPSSGYVKMAKTNGNVVDSPVSSMNCDTSIVDYCAGENGVLGKKTNGCDGSKFKIDDMFTTAYDNFIKKNKTTCGDIKPTQGASFNMETLNACYSNASATQLYNGFLVVKLNEEQSTTLFYNPIGTLNGNFIFYTDKKIEGDNVKLPTTTPKSNVLLYLGGGAKKINATNEEGNRNYFVYSKKNIEVLQNDAPKRKWTGTFYMTAEGCAKIQDINTAEIDMEYNPILVQTLLDSAVICGISEFGTCGNPTTMGDDEEDRSGEDNVEGFDIHYVATAPQLSISLESQRKNKETKYDNLTSSEYTAIKPSIVVMPRIVYLNETPSGKLQDYFNVVNLNGANETFNVSNTTCNPSISTLGALYTGGEKLASGIYNCEYTPGNSALAKNHFWVVVDDNASKKSPVRFDALYASVFTNTHTPENVDLVVEGRDTKPVTVTVKVTEVPKGWNVKKSDIVSPIGTTQSDGSQLYTVTVNPGTTTTLFAVTLDDDAEKNLMSFLIEDVGANGSFANPQTKTLQMTGEGFINRLDIPESFCDKNKHKMINDVKCEDIVARDDCANDLTGEMVGEWIYPECSERYTQETNNKWRCSFSGSKGIKLVQGSVSSLCDLFIHDSTLKKPEDGKNYNLYASYKAKVFQFKTVLEGVEHSGTKVNVYISKNAIDASNKNDVGVKKKECTSKDTCKFDAPAGYHIAFEPKETGGDNFSKWYVSGVPDAITDELLQIMPTSDTLVRAIFNKNDEHCFYSSFENTVIWCNSDESDCIDKCTSNNKNSPCSVKNGGTYLKSSWMVPYTNDGNNYKTINKQDGFLYYNSGKNNNSGNGTISYVLNRAKAGSHGKLAASFKTCHVESNKKNTLLNSGFILRANEKVTEYAIVNILGVNDGGSYAMEARVCEGNGSGIKNNNGSGNCVTKAFPGLTISNNFAETIFNVDIDVRGDKADIHLSYKEDGVWKQSSVILDIGIAAKTSGEGHFVGASLADDCFKLGNLGWEAYDWGEGVCSDIPSISCSFAANYLGGVLPINQEVIPWVGTSKWFNDPTNAFKLRKGCSISYHYNGCDVEDRYLAGVCSPWYDGSTHCASSCHGESDDGPYYVTGVNAEKLSSDKYSFTYAGLHGVSKEYIYNGSTIIGSVRDASVVVDCSGEGGNNRVYTESCGRFTVGKITQCAQSVGFRVSECNGGTECSVSVVGGSANLRASSLVGTISGLPSDDGYGNTPEINMVLKDIAGRSSQQIKISGNGAFTAAVNGYSDLQNFDPERVASIEFSSTFGFSLTKLQSDCPNSIGVFNCEAAYDGNSIQITSGILNSQNATCKIEGVGNDFTFEEKDCPPNGRFVIPATRLQETLNMTSESGRDYIFKITMVSKDDKNLEEYCTTPAMTISSNGMSCGFSEDLIEKLKDGDPLPSFNYSISNCPKAGCAVELKVNSGTPIKDTYKLDGIKTKPFTPSGTISAGTEYTYVLKYAGSECRESFSVALETSNKLLENCNIENDVFTADLNLTQNAKLKLAITDNLGNPAPATSAISDNKKPSDKLYSRKLPEVKTPGNYLVVLMAEMGKEIETCQVEYNVETKDELGCYIDAEGRFKTTAKNTTGSSISVALNCGPVGETWGDNVVNGQWGVGTIVDLDTYLDVRTEKCKEFHLWSDKMLCAVARPEKKFEEDEPQGTCGVYDLDGKKINGNVKQGQFKLKVTNLKNVPDGEFLELAGEKVKVSGGEASRDIWTGDGNGTIGYSIRYKDKEFCYTELRVKNK